MNFFIKPYEEKLFFKFFHEYKKSINNWRLRRFRSKLRIFIYQSWAKYFKYLKYRVKKSISCTKYLEYKYLKYRVKNSISSTKYLEYKYLKYRVKKSISSTKYLEYKYLKYFLVFQVFKYFFRYFKIINTKLCH